MPPVSCTHSFPLCAPVCLCSSVSRPFLWFLPMAALAMGLRVYLTGASLTVPQMGRDGLHCWLSSGSDTTGVPWVITGIRCCLLRSGAALSLWCVWIWCGWYESLLLFEPHGALLWLYEPVRTEALMDSISSVHSGDVSSGRRPGS